MDPIETTEPLLIWSYDRWGRYYGPHGERMSFPGWAWSLRYIGLSTTVYVEKIYTEHDLFVKQAFFKVVTDIALNFMEPVPEPLYYLRRTFP